MTAVARTLPPPPATSAAPPAPSSANRAADPRTRPGAGPATRSTMLPSAEALTLVDRARSTLVEACAVADATERYRLAHLGALRAAAAVIAAYAAPPARGSSRLRSVWAVLPGCAPELAEWAQFFELTARQRRLIDRGDRVPQRAADDLLREAGDFLVIVRTLLGLGADPQLPQTVVALHGACGGRA